jgi:hypothetical protein
MTQDEIIELAIQGHASTRDAIRWAMNQEREACAKACEKIRNEMNNWPDAWEGTTAETKFVRMIGETVSQPFIDAIRDRDQP